MKFNKYIKDKILCIAIYLIITLLIMLILYAGKVNYIIIIINFLLLIINGITLIIIDYFTKFKFYNNLISNTNKLDKKYLVIDLLEKPTNYEQELIYNTLYDINKSMIDDINYYKNNLIDYKEFLEIWIHEVKIPISSMILLYHNHKDKYSKKMLSIIRKLDNNIDSILYYVRSEDYEKDFLISEVSLKEIVKCIAINNKDEFIENNIDFIINVDNLSIYTDKKWLEFIINQIINNSIKYKKETNSIIKITSYKKEDITYLEIYDNGIGISETDISRVFEKSFTGINGRNKVKSTGMGLYIVKKLCQKLGHSIKIESQVNEYTKVTISFGQNNLYNIT